MDYAVGAVDTVASAKLKCVAHGIANITECTITEPNVHIRMQHAARLLLQQFTDNTAAAVICIYKGAKPKRNRDGTHAPAPAVVYSCAWPHINN